MHGRLLRAPRICTGDAERPWVEALAIAEGRILAVDAEAEAWAEATRAPVEHLMPHMYSS